VLIYRCAKPIRIDAFIKLLRPFGVLEAARSGMMALPRTPLEPNDAREKDMAKEAADVVDASALPPG